MIVLPTVSDPPISYRVEIPATAGWITLNMRMHWGERHRLTAHYRQLGQVVSLHYALPRIELAHVVAELRFRDTRRRDPHNWTPTAKAVLDGMVDAGVFPDDDFGHVVGPDMRIGAKADIPCLVMHVWPARP